MQLLFGVGQCSGERAPYVTLRLASARNVHVGDYDSWIWEWTAFKELNI